MNKEQRVKEIELILETLKSGGFSLISKDFAETYNALVVGAPSDCETNDKWQERRGELKMLSYFLSLQTVYENALKSLEDEDSGEAVNELES